MQTLSFKPISKEIIGQYRIERNDTFLRRDLYRFMNYIFDYGLQRSYRANKIPKGPAKKLARILSYKDELAYVEEQNSGYWSDFISQLARGMGLVRFDTEGKYIGYTSRERSYPDNYIEPRQESWNQYLEMGSLDKEWAIMEGLDKITENEFHRYPILFSFSRFDRTGSAINAASKMNLSKIRTSLFNILYQLRPDIWYSLSDMVAYLKENHSNLIINHNRRDYSTKENIYHCFYEYPEGRLIWDSRREIQEGEPDAFERVEGRYLTFFLEEIPFLMGFVNLAYSDEEKPPSISPSYGDLKAFSLTPKFFSVYGKDPSYNRVKVVVQANHEVVVQYCGYAETQLRFLQQYGQIIKDDQSLIFRLEKKRIADRVAEGEGIQSIIHKFQSLSSSPLPQNILQEMESWASHGEKITLYQGYSLLEVEQGRLKELSNLKRPLLDDIEKNITPNIFLVKNGERLFQYLEDQGYFPEEFQHSPKAFLYSQKTHSRLKAVPAKKKGKVKCEISLPEFAGLRCAQREILSQIEGQLQKREIPTYLLSKENLLLVPLAFRESLETMVKKTVEKSEMEVKIIE